MPASASRIAASIPDTPAPMTTTRKSDGGAFGTTAARKPRSSAAIGSYSRGTGSPTARSISSSSASPVGAGTAGGRPAAQASTASTAAARSSARTSAGNPPRSLSSMPRLRVGR
ncbi:MAG TPA: hypothetical protein VFY38_14880 [Pseudonocardia sp.]|nr:hypothetical protein [Pseudonocardia sp.]